MPRAVATGHHVAGLAASLAPRTLLGLLGLLGLVGLLGPGCGGSLVCGVEGAGPCPKRLEPAHLPELLRFVALGETRPEDVQSRFVDDHLYVTSSVGRDLRVQARGPNTGRRYAFVDVTRRTRAGAPLGELGDDYALRFEFTEFEEDGPLLLFGVQVTQPRSAPDVCRAARELASADGLEGCPPDSAHSASAPDADGFFHACVADEDERVIEVRCAGLDDQTRRLRVTLALGPATP